MVSEHDYPEDFELENGKYHRRCCKCKIIFTGHKRRVICKHCMVQDLLKSVGDFYEDQELTSEMAKSLEDASNKPPVKVNSRTLLSRYTWYLFGNKKVRYAEYGSGVIIIDEYGNEIADFPSHLDAELFLSLLTKEN